MEPEPVIVDIATTDGEPRQDLGELVAPGVAITPAETEGWWNLTHTRSGMALTGMGAVDNYDALRRAGADIGTTGIDWDQNLDALSGVDAAEGWPTARIIGELYRGTYDQDEASL